MTEMISKKCSTVMKKSKNGTNLKNTYKFEVLNGKNVLKNITYKIIIYCYINLNFKECSIQNYEHFRTFFILKFFNNNVCVIMILHSLLFH